MFPMQQESVIDRRDECSTRLWRDACSTRLWRDACSTRLWRDGLAIGVLSTLILMLPGNAGAQDTSNTPGLELTSPVRLDLRLLTEHWRGWTRAYYQSDEDAAASALEQLLSVATRLGMPRLPDLSSAACAFATLSAREGDMDRARWALDAARKLDPGRPETSFAAATVHRLDGDYLGAIVASLRGRVELFRLPLERDIWLHNLGLWLLYAFFLSGGLFVALQMATKGRALVYDLARFMSPPMALPTADMLAVVALVWPLVLPSGLLWLSIFWSILLWGYGSVSEKVVFIVLWLSLGVGSLALFYQQRAVQLSLAPPVRVLDNLLTDRLYGAMFSDLGVLRTMMSDHPAARELTADLHRRFGQWEHARSLYTTMVESGELHGSDSAAARNNLGVYHHRKKEFGPAVNYFKQASQYDPNMAEAFFNLAQAYAGLFKFSDSNMAMAQAKDIDRVRVTAWERVEGEVEENAVAVDGGLRRAGELKQTLAASWRGGKGSVTVVDLWRRHFSLSVLAGVILLAVTLHLVRNQLGYQSDLLEEHTSLPPTIDRLARTLIPGLASAREAHGGRAFFAVLVPSALLIAPLVGKFGYRAPLTYDSGQWLPTIFGIGGLVLLFLVRLKLGWKKR